MAFENISVVVDGNVDTLRTDVRKLSDYLEANKVQSYCVDINWDRKPAVMTFELEVQR